MSSESKVMKITPQQAKRAIAVLMKSKIPPVLVGPVGCGKTTAVEDFVSALNKNGINAVLETRILSQMDISNFSLPKEVEGRVHEVCAEWIPLEKDSKEDDPLTVIFFDEIDRCDQMLQNVILNILLGRKIANEKISDKVVFVGAMNGSSDMYTTPLSKAAINRLCMLYISGDNASYDKWASENGISPERRAFDKFAGHEVLEADEDFEDQSFATRRSLDFVDKVVTSINKGFNFDTKDIMLPMMAGMIGVPASIQYKAFIDLYKEAETPDQIVADPDNARIDYEPSVLFAVTTGLIEYAKDDTDLCDKVYQYAMRLPAEYKATILAMMSEKNPESCVCPSYKKLSKLAEISD